MNSLKVSALAVEAISIIRKLESVKPLYSRLEEITEALSNAKSKDLEKCGLELVDNFATKNVVWKSSAVRRFELKKVEE